MKNHQLLMIILYLLLSSCATSNDNKAIPDLRKTTSETGNKTLLGNTHKTNTHSTIGNDSTKINTRNSTLDECQDNLYDNSTLKCYFDNTQHVINTTALTRTPLSTKRTSDGKFAINFQSVDIKEVVATILGDLLDLNYTIAPDVQGLVNFSTSKPIKHNDLLPTLDMILSLHNASLVASKNIYTVANKESATAILETPTLWRKNRQLPPGLSTTIMPVKFIAANSLQQLLEPFIPVSAKLSIDNKRNLVFLTGTQKELIQLSNMIDVFDVDQFAGQTAAIYTPANMDSKTLLKELNLILSKELNADVGKLTRVLLLDGMNAILVLGTQPEYIKHIGGWIERIDQNIKEFGPKLHVYDVQNGVASDLAKLLSNLFTSTSNSIEANLLEPGADPETITSNNLSLNATSNTKPYNTSSISSFNLKGTRIVPDDMKNLLLIYATNSEYQNIIRAINKLDKQPLQVLIEASFIEVSLNDTLKYGVQWFFKGSYNNFNETGTFSTGNSSIISPQFPGFVYSLLDSTNRVRGMINALDSVTTLKLISSPSLFVLNNHTASIQVGDEVPVLTRSSVNVTTPDAPTINEIEFRETGVLLTITPRVNSSGLVTIDINQEISSAAQTTTSGIDTPTIQQRKISTTVAIQDGTTVVLGGLIREDNSNNKVGIPFLHKIPVAGTLFGRKEKSNARKELLVLVTPHIIQSNEDAIEIKNILYNQMPHLDPVMLKGLNHHDELHPPMQYN